jgi:hypothetical protein
MLQGCLEKLHAARYERFPVGKFHRDLPSHGSLLDHLVGAGEQRRRHREAERAGRLEIDHELELGRLMHRKACRLLALEDAVDVAGSAPVEISRVGPVGDQAAICDGDALGVHGGQPMAGGDGKVCLGEAFCRLGANRCSSFLSIWVLPQFRSSPPVPQGGHGDKTCQNRAMARRAETGGSAQAG